MGQLFLFFLSKYLHISEKSSNFAAEFGAGVLHQFLRARMFRLCKELIFNI